jgi:hypothetical protein
VQRVEELIGGDRRITIDSAATALRRSHGLAYNIMHDRLKFHKAYSRWVPRDLKNRKKMNLIGLSLQHLLRYADGGEDMLKRIVTGDQLWLHNHQPESKRDSMQRKNLNPHSNKKF